MKRSLGLLALVFGGCGQPAPPDPPLPEPSTFAAWASVTDAPVVVGPQVWVFCRAPSPEEERKRAAEAAAHGPHVDRLVVVRVSPEGAAAFREGRPLPVGAVVVKEKHEGAVTPGPPREYALMIKRAPGYDPVNGDWEYAYVAPGPEKESRGRLAECAGCHAKARHSDYLYRSYLDGK